MKILNLKIAFVCLLIIASCTKDTETGTGIKFENGTFKEALEKAKAEDKVVMIDFMTDWCKWCVELDKKVYTDSMVVYFANNYQVNIKIDAEKGEGIELAKKYKVTGYPTIVITKSDGTEIDRIVGYIPANNFFKRIKEIRSNVNTLSSSLEKIAGEPNDVEANVLLGEKMFDRGDSAGAVKYLLNAIKNDSANAKGFLGDAKILLAKVNNDVEGLKKAIDKYPDTKKVKDAYLAIASYYQDKDKFDSAKIYYTFAFDKYGRKDEEIMTEYVSFLVLQMSKLTTQEKNTGQDWIKAITISDECLPLAKGTVNEASAYYYLSNAYFKMGDKKAAGEMIDKAISINPTKKFKEFKESLKK
jgi:thioredoxin-related protein/Tfp pilus assembly protein PilF